MRLSGALQKKRSSELTYRELVKNSSNDDTMAAKQVSPGPGGAALGLGCWRLRDARGASPWPGRPFRPQRASGSSVAGAGEVSKRPPNLVHEGPLEILNTDLEASFQRVSFHGPGIWDLIFITPPPPPPPRILLWEPGETSGTRAKAGRLTRTRSLRHPPTPDSWEGSQPEVCPTQGVSVSGCGGSRALGVGGLPTDREGPAPHHAQQRLLRQREQRRGPAPAQGAPSAGLALPGDRLLPGHRHGERSREGGRAGVFSLNLGGPHLPFGQEDGRRGGGPQGGKGMPDPVVPSLRWARACRDPQRRPHSIWPLRRGCLFSVSGGLGRGPFSPCPGQVAACLLLFLEEEDAFWMMCAIIEDLLPASYFSTTLLGVQTDQRVLRHLIVQYLPRLDKLLQEHDIELSLITLHWFLTAFASVVHIKLLLRLWDLFFYEGSLVLFQTTLGMLRLKEEELIQSENSASIFNTLSDIPSQMEDADLLLGEAMRLAGSLTDVAVETQRRKHLAYLIADQGQLLGTSTTTNLSQVVRRRTQRRKSGISSLLFGEDDLEALKAKNIKQTELVADLREAILRVARHFQCTDPKNCSVELTPDYSMESHQRDHENYVACSRSHPRRAKALLDFERHDDDELGFRKNDIITIISQKDEHCWVGELNGLRGWFPAKFVEVLDERSKEYSIAGDDAVTEGVTDLVRGTLCPALKALFEHGLKKPSLLGGACHPWLFIEEVSQGLGPCPSLSSSLRPVELAAGAGGVATGPQLDSGFDLVAPLGSLTLTPPRRQRAGKSRETSTPCIRAWCCVRRTGWMKTAKSSPRRSCSTGLCSRST
uniref:RUN and TBC1 domain-containing protein 3 n=1 Tax=Sus scrofa TaxID=9823 RepID=A0A8D1DSB6_PIG